MALQGTAADLLTPQGEAACGPGKTWGILKGSTSWAGSPIAGSIGHDTEKPNENSTINM